ncbi:MAG: hypothetical protein P1U58_01335 [Verrucomicrobiales bacterium]|nr:hypothetical protein [Verrucomicrobiales bacterium]
MKLSANDRLTLWRLAFAGGSLWLKGMKSPPSKSERGRLIDAGFIDSTSRLDSETGRRGTYLKLSEEGWSYLDPTLLEGFAESRRGAVAFSEILTSLHALLPSKIGVSDLFRSERKGIGQPMTKMVEAKSKKPANKLLGSKTPPTKQGGPPSPSMAEASIIRKCLQAHSSNAKKPLSVLKLRDGVRLPDQQFEKIFSRLLKENELKVSPSDFAFGDRNDESNTIVSLAESSRYLGKKS